MDHRTGDRSEESRVSIRRASRTRTPVAALVLKARGGGEACVFQAQQYLSKH